MVERVYDEVRRWAQETKLPDGRRVVDQEWVQLNLARVHAKLEFVKLINWKVAAAGGANPADASATKVFATEFYTEAYRLLMEVLGPNAYLSRTSGAAVLAGRLERAFQGCSDPHLRRGSERGAARPHRPLRRRPAPGAEALRSTMDFTLTDDQQAIADLAHRILSERLPPERLRELEQTDPWFADDVWAELGEADLLGIALPEAVGGGGYGILEACLIAEQVGRTVAPVPYLSSIVGRRDADGALRRPTRQRERCSPVSSPERPPSPIALYEPGDVAVPAIPSTQATADGDGWRLDGEKSLVVGADRAAAILVPARTSESTSAVFLVPPGADGVTLERETAVSGEPQWTVRLERRGASTPMRVLGELDRRGGDRRRGRATGSPRPSAPPRPGCARRRWPSRPGTCPSGSSSGASSAPSRRSASGSPTPTSTPRPSGSPPSRPSGASSEGLDADDELMIAKFWAADGAQRVVHAAQHLHGGIGVDLDYPIHRYFRWAKVLELTLGGASPSLLRLGASLATQPVGGG